MTDTEWGSGNVSPEVFDPKEFDADKIVEASTEDPWVKPDVVLDLGKPVKFSVVRIPAGSQSN